MHLLYSARALCETSKLLGVALFQPLSGYLLPGEANSMQIWDYDYTDAADTAVTH